MNERAKRTEETDTDICFFTHVKAFSTLPPQKLGLLHRKSKMKHADMHNGKVFYVYSSLMTLNKIIMS